VGHYFDSPHKHKQRKLVVKEAMVDEGIYDVVMWINSFTQATTIHCCQGLPARRPSVGFYCPDPLTLALILKRTTGWADTYVLFKNNSVQYRLEFRCEEAITTFLERIEKYGPLPF